MIEGKAPPPCLVKIWGDYNAVGLSGEADDNCIYSLDRKTLEEISPHEGVRLFVYMDDTADDGSDEVFGFVCVLEEVVGYNSNWRARPDESTWYRDPKSW